MAAVYPKYFCTVDSVEITEGNMVYQVQQSGNISPYTYCVSHWPADGVARLEESLSSAGSALVVYQLVYGPDI